MKTRTKVLLMMCVVAGALIGTLTIAGKDRGAAYYGNATAWYRGNGPGPWIMTDQENNLVGCVTTGRHEELSIGAVDQLAFCHRDRQGGFDHPGVIRPTL